MPDVVADSEIDLTGLGEEPRDEWPTVEEVQPDEKPITLMDPKGPHHARVRDYVLQRLRDSERHMTQFYARWNISERKLQAFIDLPQYEQILRDMNNSGKPPSPVEITVPYSYATIMTIVSYISQVLAGRNPIFPVSSYSGEYVNAAQNMETILQYQCNHTRMIKKLIQYAKDGETYGLQVMRLAWMNQQGMRTILRPPPIQAVMMGLAPPEAQRTRELRTIYQGTDVMNVDPFMFFPDPRVPMAEVARKGEYVFWREIVGKHAVKSMEADQVFMWTDFGGQMPRQDNTGGLSDRNLISQGTAHPGGEESLTRNSAQLDQGTLEIIPAELGLGESNRPEKWLFTVMNKQQVVQCEPFTSDHNMHPVAVGEPYTFGYGFGQPAMSDYLGPLQDTISWFVNSHIMNVRTAMNNMFVIDPSMIEIQDFKTPGPGKILRLKKSAIGRDARSVVQQLQVQDVTRGHIGDLEGFTRFGDIMSAVGDNMRGSQDQGGRRSATESRQSFQAAGARLATHTRGIASQGVADAADMMCLNSQQFLDLTFYQSIVGSEKGMQDSIWAGPETIVGDFHYSVSDGTLPMDRVALLDVWKEIFMAVATDEQLRMSFNVVGMFEFIAELGGAKNLEQFKVQSMPDQQLMMQAQAGNVVPIPRAGAAGGPNTNVQGTPPSPGRRLMQ